MKKIILLLVLVLGLVSCKKDIQAQDGLEANKNEGRKMQEAELNALADGLYALISTTRGDILVQLFYGASPLTVINFIGLAEGTLDKVNKKGPYYDGLTFHRVISDFMIQGGDPSGDGTGGPGYSFADEINDSLQFDQPGLLAMANAGPNTNGSQFFITHVPTPHLNGKHTIFGKVLSADDQAVVNSIKQGDRIESIRIIRRGEKTQAFKATQAEFDAIDLANKAEDIAQEEAIAKEMIAIINARFPQAKVSELGVYYVIEKAGSGDLPTKGQVLKMHYDGRLLDNGMIFDNSYERGEPLEVPAGIGHVIKGWDEMMMQMQVGEKRVVILPSALGYGPRGIPGVIPPHAWLQFTMERME